jgi:hypothetical protein
MVLLLQREKNFCILRESKIEANEVGNEFGTKFSSPF